MYCFVFRHAYKYTCISFIDAGNLDFTPIRSSNFDVFETLNQNNRIACFDVTINNDQAFENTETFSLLLGFDDFVPESVRSIVTIEPSVVYVTIEDTIGRQNVSLLHADTFAHSYCEFVHFFFLHMSLITSSYCCMVASRDS